MEKNQLMNLNDRLAAYIERNQQLETENSQITKQVCEHKKCWCKVCMYISIRIIFNLCHVNIVFE